MASGEQGRDDRTRSAGSQDAQPVVVRAEEDRSRPTLWQYLGRLLLAVINLYGVLLILYLPARVLFGGRLWPVALTNTFSPWILLPSFILLPVVLWARHWPARPIGPLRLLVWVDYVWYSASFYATRAWVGPDAGSDHRPVLAQLAWRTEASN
jgi:hypothetical protein